MSVQNYNGHGLGVLWPIKYFHSLKNIASPSKFICSWSECLATCSFLKLVAKSPEIIWSPFPIFSANFPRKSGETSREVCILLLLPVIKLRFSPGWQLFENEKAACQEGTTWNFPPPCPERQPFEKKRVACGGELFQQATEMEIGSWRSELHSCRSLEEFPFQAQKIGELPLQKERSDLKFLQSTEEFPSASRLEQNSTGDSFTPSA